MLALVVDGNREFLDPDRGAVPAPVEDRAKAMIAVLEPDGVRPRGQVVGHVANQRTVAVVIRTPAADVEIVAVLLPHTVNDGMHDETRILGAPDAGGPRGV